MAAKGEEAHRDPHCRQGRLPSAAIKYIAPFAGMIDIGDRAIVSHTSHFIIGGCAYVDSLERFLHAR